MARTKKVVNPLEIKAEDIKLLLENSQAAVEMGLIRIYERQTPNEQETLETRELNGIGFSGFHAKWGTILAEYIITHTDRPIGKRLSSKQLGIARQMILHYAGQLTKLANIKLAQKMGG